MLQRISSIGSLFPGGGGRKKGPQVLEAFDGGSPSSAGAGAAGGGGGGPSSAGGPEASPKFVWDKRTASLMSLDSVGGTPPDATLLATPVLGGGGVGSGGLDGGVDDWALSPGHLSSIQAVRDRLYVGTVEAASELAVLRRHGITHVVNTLGPEFEHFGGPGGAGLVYHTLRVSDVAHEAIGDHFVGVCDFIAGALSSSPTAAVFIHCVAGVSRSTTLVIAYLMRSEGLTAAAAVEAVRAVRPEARPNAGFLEQLLAWENTLARGGGHSPVPPPPAPIATTGVLGSLRRLGVRSRGASVASTASLGGVAATGGSGSGSAGTSPVGSAAGVSMLRVGSSGRLAVGASAPTSPSAPSPLREQVRGLSGSQSEASLHGAIAAAHALSASAGAAAAAGGDASTHSGCSYHSDESPPSTAAAVPGTPSLSSSGRPGGALDAPLRLPAIHEGTGALPAGGSPGGSGRPRAPSPDVSDRPALEMATPTPVVTGLSPTSA